MILNYWHTTRLRIEDVIMNDIDNLYAIFSNNRVISDLDPTFEPMPKSIFETLIAASLNGNYQEATFKMQKIIDTSLDCIVGYYHCFVNQPQKDNIFISILVIDILYQRAGYGSEFGQNFFHLLSNKYKSVEIEVYLKNVVALAFWTKMGFDQIIRLRTDKKGSESIILRKMIEKSEY
jgi:hypothetical protein